MPKKYLIAVEEFCISHGIEISLVSSLEQYGLIEVTIVKETSFIDAEQLQQLEKIIRFYNELDINIEGIETINHLLLKIRSLQDEITMLKNRLHLYEGEENF
jgi:hypothetical protein